MKGRQSHTRLQDTLRRVGLVVPDTEFNRRARVYAEGAAQMVRTARAVKVAKEKRKKALDSV